MTEEVDIIPQLDDEHCENLKNYKYTSGEYTILDKLMGPYWRGVARLIPKVCLILSLEL